MRETITKLKNDETNIQNPLESQHRYVMERICRCFKNLMLSSRHLTDKDVIYLLFSKSLKTFLITNLEDILVKDEQLKYKKKIARTERKKLETRWRWLMGAVLAHCNYPTRIRTHPGKNITIFINFKSNCRMCKNFNYSIFIKSRESITKN